MPIIKFDIKATYLYRRDVEDYLLSDEVKKKRKERQRKLDERIKAIRPKVRSFIIAELGLKEW
jgi:hypothetical protein